MNSLSHTPSTISFEYRFHQDPKLHAEALADRKLLMQDFARTYLAKAPNTTILDSVTLYPVERAGKSGSEVFYLDVKIKGVEYPRRYIAKFQDKKNTDREHDAAFRASIAQMSNSVEKFELPTNTLGMLVCDLAKVGNHCEFRNFFLSKASIDACVSALQSAFKYVAKKPNASAVHRRFDEDYNRYVNRSSKPLERLESMLLDNNCKTGLNKIAKKILKHHERIVRDFNFDVFPYLVHGDLHARNLMVNSEDPTQTELIDFGWVDYGHPAKDFVLMEITLKHMLLHELLFNLTKSRKVSLHLPLSHYEKIEDFLCLHGVDLPSTSIFEQLLDELDDLHELQRSTLLRTYSCLMVVRSSAQLVLTDYCEKYMTGKHKSVHRHYFGSLFLVTLGLSCMSEMEPIWTLVGLEKTGAIIWKK